MATRTEILGVVAEAVATASAIKTADQLIAAPGTTLFGDLLFTSEHAMIVSGSLEEDLNLSYVDPSIIMACKDVNDLVDAICDLAGVAKEPVSKASEESRTGYVGTPDAEEALGHGEDMDAADISAFFPEFGN